MASSSSSTSSTNTSHSSPATALAPSAADGALHPANPALSSAADRPDLLAAPFDPAASPTTPNSSSASALTPTAADGAHHPPNPALSAAGPKLEAAPSDPPAASPSTTKDEWPALPSKGVGRGRRPATASASAASPSASVGAAARLPTATTYETGWGSKGRVPPATGFDVLRQWRDNRSPKKIRSGGRGSPWKAAKGGNRGFDAAPDPTSSTPPTKAWGSPHVPPRLPSGLPPSSSTATAATGAPTGASHSSHAPLVTKFAGHDTSSSSAAASSTAAAGPSASTPATARPPSTSVEHPPVQATPPSPPTLSDAFDSINSNHRGPGGGVLGAVAAAPAGGDAPVAADAFENNDKWGASDRTVEDLRRQAATESASLIGTQFERAQFPHGNILPQHGGFPGDVLGQATNAGRVLAVQESPSAAPSLSNTFDWINSNPCGQGRGVLGAVAAGGDAPVAADAFQIFDSLYAPGGTVEELRRQAAVDLVPLRDGFAGLGDEPGHPPQGEPVDLRNRCVTCLISRAEMPFSPCGHTVLCAECYYWRQRCPHCFELIQWPVQ